MKTVVITGATSGIGYEIARMLARLDCTVIGIGRSEESCGHACERIRSENPGRKIAYFTADLMQQREINRLAEELSAYLTEHCGGALDALINNAGCVRSWYTTTEEGYEQQFALNHLAGFLLTYRLLPFIQKARGKVIMTGSESHKGIRVHWDDVMLAGGYHPLTAYKQSKLCNMLFAKGLNDRLLDRGVRAYVVNPGLVNTDIGNKQTGGLVDLVWRLRKRHGVLPDVPARTYAFLCGAGNEPGGLYYYLCREGKCGRQVTSENADRLFALSERLCGVSFGEALV